MKWLITFLVLTLVIFGAKAEEVTTNNLITNGNFETGNSNSWTVTGDVQVLNDCCELNGVSSNYDLEFGDSGSIEQDFNLSTNIITQNMLDNGITLDSSMDAQNGECSVAGCWGGQGAADTFTNVLTIKDSDGNVLASNTTIRTDVTGIDGAIFTDRLIYNGTGSNVGNINISGSDANAPANLGGPNIDNVSVTMTYDTSVLDDDIVDEIGEVFEDLEDVFEYIEFVEIEQMFEEMVTFFTEPPVLEEMMPEEELSFEPMLMMVEEMELEEEFFEEEIVMEIKEEIMGKEPMTTSMFANMPEEEIIEETNELISSFLPPSEEEPAMEEEMVEEEPAMEEEMVEEEPKTMAAAPKEKEEVVEEKQEEVIEESNEEEVKEEKSTSETSTKSAVQTKKIAKQKAIQQKKALVKNLARVMEKVDKDIKNISKNLQVKNIIKMEAMTTDQVSLDSYNVAFYTPKDIYLDQLNLIDNRLIYADKSLATYIQNDKMEIKARKLQEINSKKQQLLIELEVLKKL